MDFKNHFFLTFVALMFLGVLAVKPGNVLYSVKDDRECKIMRGKMDCDIKHYEYEMNDAIAGVRYLSQGE